MIQDLADQVQEYWSAPDEERDASDATHEYQWDGLGNEEEDLSRCGFENAYINIACTEQRVKDIEEVLSYIELRIPVQPWRASFLTSST